MRSVLGVICDVLAIVQSSTVVKKTAFSTLAVFVAFAAAYVPLLFWLGYSYELHVASTVVFASLSVLVTLGLFRDHSEGFEGAGAVKVVFGGLVGVVLVEELLLNSVFAVYGFALAFFGLVFLPVLAVWLGREDVWLRIALEAVALIFVTRVVLSPFSSGFLSQSVFLPTIYTLILAALVFYLTYRRIPARDARITLNRDGLANRRVQAREVSVKLKKRASTHHRSLAKEVRVRLGMWGLRFQVASGLGVGVVIGVIEYSVLRPQPILGDVGFVQMLAYTVIVLAVMVGVVEEFLFRGLLQGSLERVMPAWQAIGVASVMFGLMHLGWMNPLEVLLAYGAGVVFGYLAILTDSLIAPVLAHGFGNLVLYLIAFYLP